MQKIVTTKNFNSIFQQCDRARTYKKLIAITGNEGTGKTIALQQYERDNENTFKIHCLKTMKAKELLTAILFSLGESFTGSPYQMTFKIAEILNSKEKPLLMFDEISTLGVSHLIYIKDIWDMVENNCGIVLCGQHYFITNLEKAVSKFKVGMPEFLSRISSFTELDEITNQEIEYICKENGIEDCNKYFNLPNFRVLSNIIKNLKEE
ncbi:ATP-binding protein [Chryseobacterium shandongense]|uniref:ATP-binding protein n=1 Tax=Chryseobacterium shandongense TaxID=1493872 RepID=A0ABM7B9F0_9FLAO|nr:ATP-binding protein [Chryseobacterium shandongense]AZA95338.1 ATP-binding protein [Chryseobacterium shandongense]